MHRWQGNIPLHTFILSSLLDVSLSAGDFLFYRLGKKKEKKRKATCAGSKIAATTVSTTPAKFSAGVLGIQTSFKHILEKKHFGEHLYNIYINVYNIQLIFSILGVRS